MGMGRFSGSSTKSRRGRLAVVGGLAAGLIAVGGGAAMNAASTLDGASEQEYINAVQDAANCVSEAGYQVSPVTKTGVTYGFSVNADGSDGRAQAIYDGCHSAHTSVTERAYLQGLETHGPDRESVYQEFIGCLRKAGVDTVTTADDESAVTAKITTAEANGANIDQAWQCQQLYLIPLFGA
ncbi:hypothetical protein [Georgenia daeguensis]|uniref:Secreted protein n=1 Tax=Georgenia daeguensis TaxID=908355 RepID=A0ABP6UQ93_9MICO